MDYKLIIFDLDKTLCEFNSTDLLPGVIEWFAENPKQWVAIATNQGGVGLRYWMERDGFGEPFKYPTEESQAKRLQEIKDKLGRAILCYQSFAFQAKSGRWSPTPPDKIGVPAWRPSWRKPEPGMLLAAMSDARVSPQETLFVGDDITDAQAAARAECEFMWANDFFKREVAP